MTDVVWSARASRDLGHQIDYIAAVDIQAADRIGDLVEERAAWLAQWPRAGQLVRLPNIRSFHVRGTPFLLIYRIDGSIVTIVRLRHKRQNWRSR